MQDVHGAEGDLVKVHLAFLAFTTGSYAQFRKYSNEFLNIGAGARGLAMGSAQVASISDGSASYWNPAALVNVKNNPQLSIMHAEYFAGIGKYDFAQGGGLFSMYKIYEAKDQFTYDENTHSLIPGGDGIVD